MKLPSDPFLSGYLVAAFWTTDNDAPSGDYAESGRPEDMMARLAPEALEKARVDCARFESENEGLLSDAYERSGYDYSRAGHDFWLTRNGHGAGYFDRDELLKGNLDEKLTAAADGFGGIDLYEGDDGKLYF